MNKDVRYNLLFIAACVAAFVLACVATALSMIQVINWYLSNCNTGSRACSAADMLISYWWLVFIPCVLIATFMLHGAYQRRLGRT